MTHSTYHATQNVNIVKIIPYVCFSDYYIAHVYDIEGVSEVVVWYSFHVSRNLFHKMI